MPRNDVRMLFLILLIFPVFILLIVTYIGWRGKMVSFAIETAEILLLHMSLSMIYIASYPAAQAHSPSLSILLFIASSPSKKMRAEDIIMHYSDEHTVIKRFEDLKIYGLIEKKGDRFELNIFGKMIILSYIIYRTLLGLPPGEG